MVERQLWELDVDGSSPSALIGGILQCGSCGYFLGSF
jgi:hypothetical protein